MVRRQIRIKIRDTWHTVEVEEPIGYPLQVFVDGELVEVEIETPNATTSLPPRNISPVPPPPPQSKNVGLTGLTQENEKVIRSPMPGRVVSVSVEVWDTVETDAEVCVLETMKMEQSILIAHRGVIRAVFVKPGQNVAVGDLLVQLE